MITPSQLAIVCRRLESELQKAGLVLSDVQFDHSDQILCIVVDDGPDCRLSRTPRADGGSGATIDAHVLWDLLRDLIRLGVNPAIQLRHRRQDAGQTHEVRGSDDSWLH